MRFENEEQRDLALLRHKHHMGNRYIEVRAYLILILPLNMLLLLVNDLNNFSVVIGVGERINTIDPHKVLGKQLRIQFTPLPRLQTIHTQINK